jgi:transposase
VHLVTKQIKGHEYFYLVEKERRGDRVVTSRTVYVGDRKKLVDLVQTNSSSSFPSSFAPQAVGAALALAAIASDLGVEDVIDAVCPVRDGAVPAGRRLLVTAIHCALAGRRNNSKRRVLESFEGSALADILPLPAGALDNRRICELLSALTPKQVDAIEASLIRRVVDREGVTLGALAFDCTNFDSYAAASTRSRLLRRGHAKSGRPLRILGLGLLVTEDDGMPLLSFVYPGNENDVTAFGRFLKALDRRRASLDLPVDTTVAADGGNISRQLLLRLERDTRYYVLRLPPRHVGDLPPCKSEDLPALGGSLRGKVWARKVICPVYGKERCVVDVYSQRMHKRQLPGLHRDRKRARADLLKLQQLLERQRQGLRRVKPLTLRAVKRRVEKALAREHMADLFPVRISSGPAAPHLEFDEPAEAWQHLQDYVLGRTLLVTNRRDWAPEQTVLASRLQSHNERFFRDIKDPAGVSILPLRHRRDAALRAHALVAVLGLLLAKVLQRRLKRAGVRAPSLASVLAPLKTIQRARLQYGPDAPPALRALAKDAWIPSERTPRQQEILAALKLDAHPVLGTTLLDALKGSARRRTRRAAK